MVHIIDILETGNLAPGNTIQNFANLVRPTLLIGFLIAARRVESKPESEVGTTEFDQWRQPYGLAAGIITAVVATGFGLGFAVGQSALLTMIGIIISLIVLIVVIHRSAWHQLRWG